MEPFIIRMRADLDGMLPVSKTLNGMLVAGDALANRILVEVYQDNEPISLSSGDHITAYVTPQGGQTLSFNGAIVGGKAQFDLPASVYDDEGSIFVSIRLTSRTRSMTIATVQIYRRTIITGEIIQV